MKNFEKSRWDCLKNNYESWWTDKIERPLFNVTIHGQDPDRPMPEGISRGVFSQYELDVPVEVIIKHLDYQLSGMKYWGDGYPSYLPDFGAGVNAAFAGARHIVRPESVWFEAESQMSFNQLKLRHQADNVVYRRIAEFYQKANAYFDGSVVLGMTHLNNGIDIPARFFNGVDFCLGMIDNPEEIERLVWENHALFEFYIKDLSGMMFNNPGYTCWGNILANEPWMGTQSDFCAMIGPDHFDRFVLPELQACVKESPKYNFYHLDGREELIHLDKILEIPNLQVVQWVAGDGELADEAWMWLYKKIRDAGKKIWYMGPEENLDRLAETLGSLKGVYWQVSGSLKDEDRLLRTLERFGIPADAGMSRPEGTVHGILS